MWKEPHKMQNARFYQHESLLQNLGKRRQTISDLKYLLIECKLVEVLERSICILLKSFVSTYGCSTFKRKINH